MANQKSFFIRLYPFTKNKIDDTLIRKIVNELEPIFFDNACFYFSPNDRSYLDINFHYRNWLPNFFSSRLINEKFHVWIRKADEGGMYDYISFSSDHYNINNKTTLDYFGVEWSAINLKNIQYNNSCLYKADKLSIYGNTEKAIIFVQNILSGSFLRGIRKSNVIKLDSNLEWHISLPIRFLASNFSDFRYSKNVGKTQNLNIYKTLELQGHLSHAMIEDFSLTFNNEMKKIIFSDNEYDSVNSIKMEYMENVVYKFEQNTETRIKKQISWNNWSNCIDEEFVKFLSWYNKK